MSPDDRQLSQTPSFFSPWWINWRGRKSSYLIRNMREGHQVYTNNEDGTRKLAKLLVSYHELCTTDSYGSRGHKKSSSVLNICYRTNHPFQTIRYIDITYKILNDTPQISFHSPEVSGCSYMITIEAIWDGMRCRGYTSDACSCGGNSSCWFGRILSWNIADVEEKHRSDSRK